LDLSSETVEGSGDDLHRVLVGSLVLVAVLREEDMKELSDVFIAILGSIEELGLKIVNLLDVSEGIVIDSLIEGFMAVCEIEVVLDVLEMR
jgi:hypothetical protein